LVAQQLRNFNDVIARVARRRRRRSAGGGGGGGGLWKAAEAAQGSVDGVLDCFQTCTASGDC